MKLKYFAWCSKPIPLTLTSVCLIVSIFSVKAESLKSAKTIDTVECSREFTDMIK